MRVCTSDRDRIVTRDVHASTKRRAAVHQRGRSGSGARNASRPVACRTEPPDTDRIVLFAHIGVGCSARLGTAGARDSTLDGYAANVLDIRGEPAPRHVPGRSASPAIGVQRHPEDER
ncbi:hypothetical protein KRM28CT15_18350 [Krasilnikovia sp. M28-CT-15]